MPCEMSTSRFFGWWPCQYPRTGTPLAVHLRQDGYPTKMPCDTLRREQDAMRNVDVEVLRLVASPDTLLSRAG